MSESGKGVLADTSVWLEFFKQRSTTGDTVESLIREGWLWVCGLVLFELVQGLKSEAERARIFRTISQLPYVEMTPALWQQAGDLSSSLRKRGLTIPLSDILFAAIAIEHDLHIFTLDAHFEQIPGVKIYKPR